MKKHSHIWKAALFVILLGAMLSALTGLLARKESTEKYRPFYEAAENFDVLFFGTSHGANGFSPMELWHNYGIASYNLSQHSEYPAVTYWKVLDALAHADPSLIVIDSYLAATDTKLPEPKDYSYVHKSLDGMPFSLRKVMAVLDLVPDLEHRAEFLWNFIMYHNRYTQLREEDFRPDYSVEKGAESRVGVLSLSQPQLLEEDVTDEREWLGELTGFQYFRRIVEVCRERDIRLLFVNLPYFFDESAQKLSNSFRSWCEGQGVEYLDLFREEELIDYATDLYDYGHLNPSGYRKVNRFLGEYLREQYELPDRRREAEYEHWNTDYLVYLDKLEQEIREADNLFVYLMMLQNENFGYTITVNPSSGALDNPYLTAFWKALGVDVKGRENDGQQAVWFLTADRGSAQMYENPVELCVDTSFGQIEYLCEDGVLQTISVNGMKHTIYSYEPVVQLMVFNRLTGKQVDYAEFSLQNGYQRETE